jgi:excisionase family DNA binding protein
MNAKNQDWIDEALAALPPICTTEEAQSVLRMGRRNLYRLISAGRIKTIKGSEGGSARRLIPKSALASYLRSIDGGQ